MAKKQEPNQGLQELKAALSRKETCGAYVFYGEEVFLMHYYLDRLKKLAIDEVTESFNLIRRLFPWMPFPRQWRLCP